MGRQAWGAVAITLLTLALIIGRTWQESSWETFRSFRWSYLGLAILLLAASLVLDVLRIHAMTRAAGYRISWLVGLRTVLSGYFVAAVTPFLAGGAPVQAYSLYRSGVPLGVATTVILSSGIMAQLCLVILAVILVFGLQMQISPHQGVQQLIRLALIIYALGLGGFSLLAWHIDRCAPLVRRFLGASLWQRLFTKERRERWAHGITKFLQDLGQSFREFFAGQRVYILLGALAYLCFFACIFGVAPVLMRGLGKEVNALALIGLQIPVYLLVSVIPTPGGSGGLEAGMAMAFASHLPRGEVGIFVAGWRLLNLYYHLCGGGVGLLLVTTAKEHQGGEL
ncbi:MAG: lysylphosphatidylglycerol synthase transmembrane domain-containing protein [Limnochordia bacterium]|jgi:uncharacterized protein (TIRG00374 family)